MSSDLIQHVKNKFDYARIPCCREAGCELRLNGLINYVVLKGELLCKNRKMADCIIFVRYDAKVVIGIVELKSGNMHAEEVKEKLTNSLEVAFNILDDLGRHDFQYRFHIIVLCRKWDDSEYRIIISKKIKFHGKNYSILPKKCNDSFSLILKKYE